MRSIRNSYEDHGVSAFYEKGVYENPHVMIVQKLVLARCSGFKRVLDLACGNGEVTVALPQAMDVVGCDPYLSSSYVEKTGRMCHTLSFADIAESGFPEKDFDAIICSFALHLAPPSMLPLLLYQLSVIGKTLIVISPSKFPVIDENWPWKIEEHTVKDRVHFRRFIGPLTAGQ